MEPNYETKLSSGKFKAKHDLEHCKVTRGINKCFNCHGGVYEEGGENLRGSFLVWESKGQGKGIHSSYNRN